RDVGARQYEQIVVALEITAMLMKSAGRRAAKIRFAELALLDHRSQRAVENQDAFLHQAGQKRGAVGLHAGLAFAWSRAQILTGMACNSRAGRQCKLYAQNRGA